VPRAHPYRLRLLRMIAHGAGVVTLYAHLMETDVNLGDRVTRGHRIVSRARLGSRPDRTCISRFESTTR